jgi:hypothetical protein
MGDPADSLRARSAKLTPADFVLLKTIGQGSFGLVLQVHTAPLWLFPSEFSTPR